VAEDRRAVDREVPLPFSILLKSLWSILQKRPEELYMAAAKSIVFVVDDEAVIALTLTIILNRAGFQASAFDHSDKAIAACESMTPDLLISDVVMPGMSGIDLALHFRKTLPECRVLLFSGQAATVDLLQEARELGYDFDVLSKPVHPNDLLAKLRS
jgi:DNA-binding NtrC family response regulator